jgi:hypothetical protein
MKRWDNGKPKIGRLKCWNSGELGSKKNCCQTFASISQSGNTWIEGISIDLKASGMEGCGFSIRSMRVLNGRAK